MKMTAIAPRARSVLFASVLVLMVASVCVEGARADDGSALTKIHPSLDTRLNLGDTTKVWVYFADKGPNVAARLEATAEVLDDRTLTRRRLRRSAPGLVDHRDLAVAETYLDAVTSTGAAIHVTSRWLNAVSAYVNEEQVNALAALPFVARIEPVRGGSRIGPVRLDRLSSPPGRGLYGHAEVQLSQINLIALHGEGFTGAGMTVGVLDTGFQRSHSAFHHPDHPLSVIAEWDFIDNDGDTSAEPGDPGNQHEHGTLILGTLAAYAPDLLLGAAYEAEYILCKTEDITGEYPAEEDNYVAGLEFAELNGADVVTSSLGYIDWYTQDDLDGLTAVTTIAVNVATENGVICCTAAGNNGHDGNPNTSALIAPSDGFQVITCGAVEANDETAGFSSDGPTADGRVKPELLALGDGTATIDPYGDQGYWGASGTSLSTPLVAGAVTCVLQANPNWTVDLMRQQLFATASDFVFSGEPDPLHIRGYGIVDAQAAAHAAVPADLNGDGCVDQADLGALLGAYGVDDGGDIDGDGDTDQGDLGFLLGSYGAGCG
jgi:subtilisin family serine protease